jgi:hypothetical protein
VAEPASSTGVRRLPVEFDRLVIILTVQAHLWNLVYILTQPGIYRSWPAALTLWAVSFTVPIACLVTARRTQGVLSTRAFLIAAAVLIIGVDLGLTLLVHPAYRGSPAVWQWSAVGVSILTLSPFRPPRDILSLAAVHAVAAGASLALAAGESTVSGYRAVQDISAALLPAFAAAQYVQLYGRALRLRDRAVAQERDNRTQAEAARAVAEDSRRRLGALRGTALRLLTRVRDGDDPQAPAVTSEAQRLSAAVRSELVEARSGAWLLDGAGIDPDVKHADAAWPGLILLDPEHRLELLSLHDRSSLAGVVAALRTVGPWHRVSVAVVGGEEDRTTLAVVAAGPAAADAMASPVVAACVQGWGATVTAEGPGLVTVDTDVDLQPTQDDAAGLTRDAALLMANLPSTFGTRPR